MVCILFYTEHPFLAHHSCPSCNIYITLKDYCSEKERERVNTMGFIVSTIEQFHNYSIGRIEQMWQYKERQWQWQWQWQHTMTTLSKKSSVSTTAGTAKRTTREMSIHVLYDNIMIVFVLHYYGILLLFIQCVG